MSAFLSRFSPVPSFPSFIGPYQVGSFEVEIPVGELSYPHPAPDPTIPTVSFRIFYPCEAPTEPTRPVFWLPDPQRAYLGAYIRFLGASRRLSSILQYLPFYDLISRVTIPVFRNAKLLPPPTQPRRWPLMLFSHGLGGSRNAYSQIAGSMASHGMVVIAPDHRDGSAPVSFARNPDGSFCEIGEYRRIPFRVGQDVEVARNEQLRIRLWELVLIHEALLKIDRQEFLTNMVPLVQGKNSQPGDIAMFGSSLDIHTPGSILWAGHSFGALTVLQFVKSVFYHRDMPSLPPSQSLYSSSENSPVEVQITPSSPLILFDLWSLPLRTEATEWLRMRPLPCYTVSDRVVSNVLSIVSDAFQKWQANLTLLREAVFPEYTIGKEKAAQKPQPHVFYHLTSAHMGQSDFGVLSPKLSQKVFKCDDPIRAMHMNILAALEMLRQNGYEVGETSPLDMKPKANGHVFRDVVGQQPRNDQDSKILDTDGSIKGWIALTAGGETDEEGAVINVDISDKASPSEAVVKGEILKDQTTNGVAQMISNRVIS